MLLHEKADQAQALLAETGLDCWLTFARETDLHPDPGVEQVVGAGVVRNSAFLFGAGGERIAIVANFDTSAIRAKGVFREVVGYDEDIRGPLLAALRRLDPRQIGLNYSTDDVTADGLTHGHWLLLQQLLGGTPYLWAASRAGPGHLAHIDLGVRLDGYGSDLQRMWYVRRPGESAPPADVQRAFDTVVRAIDAGAAALRPGARGVEVDAAARK